MNTYTGTVTVTTKYPEAPLGVSVAAGGWPSAASKAARVALARRKASGAKGRPAAICIKLTRAARLEPPVTS